MNSILIKLTRKQKLWHVGNRKKTKNILLLDKFQNFMEPTWNGKQLIENCQCSFVLKFIFLSIHIQSKFSDEMCRRRRRYCKPVKAVDFLNSATNFCWNCYCLDIKTRAFPNLNFLCRQYFCFVDSCVCGCFNCIMYLSKYFVRFDIRTFWKVSWYYWLLQNPNAYINNWFMCPWTKGNFGIV